jgi:isopenicillin N synthase-like dioxygenase
LSEIPIIDVAGLRSSHRREREAVALSMGRAARDVGFLYVVGHGLPITLLHATFEAAHALFDLPAAKKQALDIRHSPHNRGYAGFLTEQLDETALPDRKEAFNIGFDLAADDPEVLAGAPFRGVNVWPDLPGWRATMLAYFDACMDLSRVLHRGFALDLGIAEEFFTPLIDRPMATLRMLRYPPRDPAAPAEALGAGTHTDYGNITLLATDGVAGLEVRRRDGAWIEAPSVPNALVVNIGDLLMRWTNDIYVSTPHRVRQPEQRRHSLAFFLDPNPDAIVAVLPECLKPGEAPRYPPVSGADYLRSRLDATYIGAGVTGEGGKAG